MDELLQQISPSTSGRQPAPLTDRDKEEGGGGQSITDQHKLRAGWLCPSPSPFPSLLSPAPVPQLAGRWQWQRPHPSSVPRGGEGRSGSDSAVGSACSPWGRGG